MRLLTTHPGIDVHPFVHRLISNSLLVIRELPVRLTERPRIEALIQRLRPQYFEPGLIRLGPRHDGGYLVPDDLEGIAACFSPGVDRISGFELDCAGLGMEVHLADNSVEHPAESHERFHFTRKHLGVTTDDVTMTLDDWVQASHPGDDDLLLQIDIEGAEFEVFLGASDALMRRFKIIVAEFHSLDQLWNEPFFNLASRAFEKILQTHHCLHIHPNNYRPVASRGGLEIPEVAEFTFLRKDRFTPSRQVGSFPHPLDSDNAAHLPPLPLPPIWYAPPTITPSLTPPGNPLP